MSISCSTGPKPSVARCVLSTRSSGWKKVTRSISIEPMNPPGEDSGYKWLESKRNTLLLWTTWTNHQVCPTLHRYCAHRSKSEFVPRWATGRPTIVVPCRQWIMHPMSSPWSRLFVGRRQLLPRHTGTASHPSPSSSPAMSPCGR